MNTATLTIYTTVDDVMRPSLSFDLPPTPEPASDEDCYYRCSGLSASEDSYSEGED